MPRQAALTSVCTGEKKKKKGNSAVPLTYDSVDLLTPTMSETCYTPQAQFFP